MHPGRVQKLKKARLVFSNAVGRMESFGSAADEDAELRLQAVATIHSDGSLQDWHCAQFLSHLVISLPQPVSGTCSHFTDEELRLKEDSNFGHLPPKPTGLYCFSPMV